MGKIAEAAEALAAVEAEIAELVERRRHHQLEAIRLDGSDAPGDIQDREGHLKAMEAVDRQIPARSYKPGEPRPKLAWKLEQVKQSLENVRDQGARLAAILEKRQALADKYAPHLDALDGAYTAEGEVFALLGWPSDEWLRAWRGRNAWLTNLRRDIAAIPHIEKQLTAMGPDPLGAYVDPTEPTTSELEFMPRRIQEGQAREQLRIATLEEQHTRRLLSGAR